VAFNIGGFLVSDEAAAKAVPYLSYALTKKTRTRLINILLLDILGEIKIRTIDPRRHTTMGDSVRNVQGECSFFQVINIKINSSYSFTKITFF
jgi:hypothetical protein